VARLVLSFLGGFQVVLDGHPVTEFKSNKARALLAYLAVEADRPHRREVLAGLLWPDRRDRDALSNLRYTLASLRKTLGDRSLATPFLSVTHDTIQFNQASDVWLDVAELERLVVDARTRRLTGADAADLTSALSLYRGSLLEGFSVGDAAPFEEWEVLRREHIAQRVMVALANLVADLQARGEYKEAQTFARRQVALEPWNEQAHRNLMVALALDGQRNAALHQFETCCRIVRDELGVDPAEETTALCQAIRAGTLMEAEGRKRVDKPSAVSLSTHPSGMIPSLFDCPVPPFVARKKQLARLDAVFAKALAGAGRVLFVTGEAGSGKTALLGEFTRRAMQAHADLLVAGGACDAATGIGDPYLPFRDILQLLTGDIEAKRAGATLTQEHARRLWKAMPDAVQALVERGPDLIDTFVPVPSLALRAEAFAKQTGRGAWQDRLEHRLRMAGSNNANRPLPKTDIFEQVTQVLQILARRYPLCLVLDDLQWADAGSISLLFHLGRRIATSRILVIAAYRPDAMAPQPESGRHPLELVVHELQRISGDNPIDLDECEGRDFIAALLGAEPNHLEANFGDLLYGHTEGHPLFTVELLHSMEERGELQRDPRGRWMEGPTLHWEKLPSRVEAAIAERVGRLSDRCRTLLAAASVEGEEFTAEVVARAVGVDEMAVVQCLSDTLTGQHRLVSAVSVRRLGARRLSRYRFRHHLFQQYLYDHLDGVRCAHLHEAIGSALELLYGEAPDEIEALAPRLAWHFEVAGLAGRAAAYYLRAGNRAVRLAAHEEAINHLTHGLALLEGLPDSPERTRLQLDLQLAVVSPLAFARGFVVPERIQALERAYEISQHPVLSDSPKRGMALAAVACFALWSAEPERTLQLGEQLLCLAERSRDMQDLRLAHFLLGAARLLGGELVAADEHLEEALALSDRRSHHPQDLIFGMPVGVTGLAWQSTVVWLLGYPERASRYLEEALAAARDSDHPMALAFARSMAAAILFLIGRDAAAAWRQIEALRPLSEKGAVFGAWADSLTGREPRREGQDEESLRQMRQGMASYQMLGGGFGSGLQLLLLAQGYARTGQAEAGLGALDEALAWMERTGVRCLEAEAHRLRGELLLIDQPLRPDAVHLAEACFRNAIAVAREQEARWWELRATVSLCRLLKENDTSADGSHAEAHHTLSEIYSGFSEGFGTQDLREARRLLEEAESQFL
jgi:DNA-binding SARP family transcriptional activator